MNSKRYLIASVCVFIFVFIFDFIFHGMLLKGMYEATASVWRPEMDHNMIWMLIRQIVFSLVITYIFTMNYEGRGTGEGCRFGFWMGALVGSMQIGTYCYLPIPFMLMVWWVVGSVLTGIGIGLVCSWTYRN